MARVKSVMVAGMATVFGCVPVVAQDASTPLSPVPLFTQVCTAGGGHLSKDAVRPATYAQLPDEARNAIGFGAPGHMTVDREMVPSEVPNPMLKVGVGTYLMLPSPGRSGVMAQSCAVAWKGHDFDTARDAVYALAGVKAPPVDADFSPVQNAHIVQVNGPGFMLIASEIWGWTMLREAPLATDTPSAAVRPVSALPSAGKLNARDKGNGETVITSH